MASPNLHLPTDGRSTPVGTPKSKRLAELIAKMHAAVSDVEKWAPREDALNDQFRKTAGPTPKVKGGMTGASKVIRDGYPDVDFPASDWFYSSREEIMKAEEKAVLDATSEEELAGAERRFAALLADWDAQEAERNKAKPRGLAHAKRMLSKAHTAWTAAEDEIVNHQPRSMEEAIELLTFAGRDEMRGVFFTPDEGQLKFMMRNIGAAVAKFHARGE